MKKRLTRFDAMFYILNYAHEEEYKLKEKGDTKKLYQYQHAKEMLIYFLNDNPIKKIPEKIERMTEYVTDEDGDICPYSPIEFVANDNVRQKLIELKKRFEL